MKDYKSLAMNFNVARMNLETEVFTKKEMYHLLTDVIGFGKDSQLLSLLCEKNILRHIGHSQYMFPQNPVYYGKLQIVLQLRNRQKYEKYGKMDINKAVKVCRKHGYSVIKFSEA